MMKVNYIFMQFPVPSETFACSDIQALRKKGIEVKVFSLLGSHQKLETLLHERGLEDLEISSSSLKSIVRGIGIAVLNFKMLFATLWWLIKNNVRHPRHLIKSFALLPRAFDILSKLKKNQPDIVHLFWGHYPSMLVFLIKRALPQIYITMFLGAYDLEMDYPGSHWAAAHVDMVFTHAEFNKPRLLQDTKQVTVVYRGVDTKNFERLHLGSHQKIRKRILTAGRLIKKKGMGQVLQTFKKVLTQEPEATLVVLGDGPEKCTLQNMAKDLGIEGSVSFLGHVSQDRVLEEMSLAQVFLFLSSAQSDRLPNVAKEAMVCGCICLLSKTPGIEELIEHGKNGFLVDHDNVEAAAKMILQFFSLPAQDYKELLIWAKKTVYEKFDASKSMEKYFDVWRSLLSENHADAIRRN